MATDESPHDKVTEAYAGKLGMKFMRETRRRVHWICESVTGMNVLDIGCSQGIGPILLGREGKAITGVDPDIQAIDAANASLSKEPANVQGKVRFVAADFMTCDEIHERIFDTVVLGEVLEHLVRPQDFLAKAASHLPVGGRIVVTVPFGINDYSDHKQTFYLTEPYRLVAEHFEVVSVKMLGNWIGLVGSRRDGNRLPELPRWSDEQVLALEDAFFNIERVVRDTATDTKAKLEDAQLKYREVSPQIPKLKEQLTAAAAAQKEAETRLGDLREQREKLAAELETVRHNLSAGATAHAEEVGDLRRVMAEAARAAHDSATSASAKIQGLVERLRNTEQRQADAEQRQQEASAAVADLEQRLAQNTTVLTAAETAVAETRALLDEQREQRARLEEELENVRNHFSSFTTAHAEEIGDLRRVMSEAARAAQESATAASGKIQSLVERLRDAEHRHQEASAAVADLEQRLAQNATALTTAETALAETRSQLDEQNEQRARLEEELEGVRNHLSSLTTAHAEEVGDLRRSMSDAARAAQESAAVSSGKIQSLVGNLREAEQRHADAEQRHADAERRHQEASAAVADLEQRLGLNTTALTAAETQVEALQGQLEAANTAHASAANALRQKLAEAANLAREQDNARTAERKALQEQLDLAATASNAERETLRQQIADAIKAGQAEKAASEAEIQKLQQQLAASEKATEELKAASAAHVEELLVASEKAAEELKAANAARVEETARRSGKGNRGTESGQCRPCGRVAETFGQHHRCPCPGDRGLRQQQAAAEEAARQAAAAHAQEARELRQQQAAAVEAARQAAAASAAKATQLQQLITQTQDKLESTEKNRGTLATQLATLTRQLEIARQNAAAEATQQLAALRISHQKIEKLEARIQRDALNLQRKVATLEGRAIAAKNTISFRLGNLLLNGWKSPAALTRLPGELIRLREDTVARRQAKGGKARPDPLNPELIEMLSDFSGGGLPAVQARFASRRMSASAQANALTTLAQHLLTVLPDKAADVARAAYQADPQPARAKWLAFRLYEAGHISEPARLLAEHPAVKATPAEQKFADEIAAFERIRQKPPLPKERRPQPDYQAEPGKLLYVAASVLPYHTTGYTTRTHEFLKALRDAGMNVVAVTRPGYPWDREDRNKGTVEDGPHVLDGVEYHHLRQPARDQQPLDGYLEESAHVLAVRPHE